jgi:hypothetical protein
VAFIRSGSLLRVASPAELRGVTGARGVEVALAGPVDPALVDAARAIAGVGAAESRDGRLIVTAAEPAAVTPSLVRALVAGGADILEVHERASTLEEAYFDVMGVRPEHDEAA